MRIKKLFKKVEELIFYGIKGRAVYVNFSNIDNDSMLLGKTIVIVGGGSRGLGYDMAKRFISLGAKVIITGRNRDTLIKAKNDLDSSNIDIMEWDVSNVNRNLEIISELTNKYQRIDAFINNAAVYYLDDFKFLGQSEENWNSTMDTNLKGLHYACQCQIGYFLKSKGGKIINITSIGGVLPGYTPYDLSKCAANSLTRALAKRYISNNIIINAIAPGEMPTELGQPRDINGNLYYKGQRNHRLTLTQEIAELAAFLLSDSANNICGQIICNDGGASL